MDEEVGVLRFPRSTLSRDDDALIGPFVQHATVSSIRYSEDVRIFFSQKAVLIPLQIFGVVYGEELEGVDGDEDVTGVCVDLVLVEPTA